MVAKNRDTRNEKKIKGWVKMIRNIPKNLVLYNRNKVLSRRSVDSNEENRMIIFLLSQMNGLNKQENMMEGLLARMPVNV